MVFNTNTFPKPLSMFVSTNAVSLAKRPQNKFISRDVQSFSETLITFKAFRSCQKRYHKEKSLMGSEKAIRSYPT